MINRPGAALVPPSSAPGRSFRFRGSSTASKRRPTRPAARLAGSQSTRLGAATEGRMNDRPQTAARMRRLEFTPAILEARLAVCSPQSTIGNRLSIIGPHGQGNDHSVLHRPVPAAGGGALAADARQGAAEAVPALMRHRRAPGAADHPGGQAGRPAAAGGLDGRVEVPPRVPDQHRLRLPVPRRPAASAADPGPPRRAATGLRAGGRLGPVRRRRGAGAGAAGAPSSRSRCTWSWWPSPSASGC